MGSSRGGWLTVLLSVFAASLVLVGCGKDKSVVRGVVVISIDTLRADRLGTYGYELETSPTFDRLAERGVLFERAYVQLPGTLPSHMSIFTGLYPAEHGVYPPDGVLSPRIPTLPGIFRQNGFRTAGFTEGGYTAGHFGFDRGFDQFEDHWSSVSLPAAVARTSEVSSASVDSVAGAIQPEIDTFRRGLEFLSELESDERYFLFLHTYAVHDPYDPPQEYRDLFVDPAIEPPFVPDGPNLVEVNRGKRSLTPAGLALFEQLYDGGIRYLDDQLAVLFERLETVVSLDETVFVLTSDHGEEFMEHGKLVHESLYPETLHVPLLILAPGGVVGSRVEAVVESIDLAPTVYELAGVDPPERLSGESLVPFLDGQSASGTRVAYSEAYGSSDRSLVVGSPNAVQFLLQRQPKQSSKGVWIDRELRFDHQGEQLQLALDAFHRSRSVQVEIDGEPLPVLKVAPGVATPLIVNFPKPGPRTVRLASDSCDRPIDLGKGVDSRCLSVRVRGESLASFEFYDLRADPLAAVDLAHLRDRSFLRSAELLNSLQFEPAAPPASQELTPELQQQLESLGYLQ